VGDSPTSSISPFRPHRQRRLAVRAAGSGNQRGNWRRVSGRLLQQAAARVDGKGQLGPYIGLLRPERAVVVEHWRFASAGRTYPRPPPVVTGCELKPGAKRLRAGPFAPGGSSGCSIHRPASAPDPRGGSLGGHARAKPWPKALTEASQGGSHRRERFSWASAAGLERENQHPPFWEAKSASKGPGPRMDPARRLLIRCIVGEGQAHVRKTRNKWVVAETTGPSGFASGSVPHRISLTSRACGPLGSATASTGR